MSAPPIALPGLHWREEGQAVLSGPLLAAREALDRRFRGWAAEMQGEEFRFPPLMPARELDRLDYFRSFPHLITLAATLDRAPDRLRAFTRAPLDAAGAMRTSELAPVQEVLTPAACYHFYVLWQGQELPERRVATTVATCFRREEYYAPLRRQWSFTMRELVCLGSSDEVDRFLAGFRERLARLLAAVDLPVAFAAATDPFFDASRNPKFLAQKLDPVKTELRYGDLAIGSLNHHRNFFGETFGIARGGEPVFSGCVAFGLERWLFALADRFGPDPSRWPRELVGEETTPQRHRDTENNEGSAERTQGPPPAQEP